ncbi:hypothetical protein GCM10009734_95770 [Nonomuraea bangladeshensis]
MSSSNACPATSSGSELVVVTAEVVDVVVVEVVSEERRTEVWLGVLLTVVLARCADRLVEG